MTPEFEAWREEARRNLYLGKVPGSMSWLGDFSTQGEFFGGDEMQQKMSSPIKISVPPEFFSLAQTVSCHSAPERWDLLYQALWRLHYGEKQLLEITTDDLVHRLYRMQKEVRRDAHKTKAFVRFRLMRGEGQEHYIAWHRPDHKILPIVAPFFQRRFSAMRWTILTPQQSVHWNGGKLIYGSGAAEKDAPSEDMLEDTWRTYYRAIFNPARIKIKAMKKEMPVRHWATLPEAKIIPALLEEAPERVREMIARQEGFAFSAEQFLPEDPSLPSLRKAASSCEGCPLHRIGTCTVFGEGPENAQIMLVGEQPGDEEDKVGKPFVGPAGQVLNEAMEKAEIDRRRLYLTNAVKHFKHDRHGIERTHRTPDRREIAACHPWLKAEIAAIKPKIIVTLGVSAGRSLFGPGFSLKKAQAEKLQYGEATVVATYHPAAMLRMPDAEMREKIFGTMAADLKRAAALAEKIA
jgi:probable DNA metabolism protein